MFPCVGECVEDDETVLAAVEDQRLAVLEFDLLAKNATRGLADVCEIRETPWSEEVVHARQPTSKVRIKKSEVRSETVKLACLGCAGSHVPVRLDLARRPGACHNLGQLVAEFFPLCREKPAGRLTNL